MLQGHVADGQSSLNQAILPVLLILSGLAPLEVLLLFMFVTRRSWTLTCIGSDARVVRFLLHAGLLVQLDGTRFEAAPVHALELGRRSFHQRLAPTFQRMLHHVVLRLLGGYALDAWERFEFHLGRLFSLNRQAMLPRVIR